MPKRNAKGVMSSKGGKPQSKEQWGAYICAPWGKNVENFIETGKRLLEAKADKENIPHGEWGGMFTEGRLVPGPVPFTQRIGNMLMRPAKHPVLSNSKFFSNLPPCYSTLYVLSFLSESEVLELIEAGKINPSMTGSEAKVLGMNRPERAFRALRLLVEIRRYLKATELAEVWGDDLFHILGSNEIRELEALPQYIAELQALLWSRCQEHCTEEHWKPNEKVIEDEYADA